MPSEYPVYPASFNSCAFCGVKIPGVAFIPSFFIHSSLDNNLIAADFLFETSILYNIFILFISNPCLTVIGIKNGTSDLVIKKYFALSVLE